MILSLLGEFLSRFLFPILIGVSLLIIIILIIYYIIKEKSQKKRSKIYLEERRQEKFLKDNLPPFAICPSCKKRFNSDSNYCPYCGLFVSYKEKEYTDKGEPSEISDKRYFCKKCGKTLTSIHNYCPSCGNKFN